MPLRSDGLRPSREGGSSLRSLPTPQSLPYKGREGLFLRRFGRQLLGLLDRFVDAADHVEGVFGQMVIFAFDHGLERLHRVFDLDELARNAGEDFGDVEGLRRGAMTIKWSRSLDGGELS